MGGERRKKQRRNQNVELTASSFGRSVRHGKREEREATTKTECRTHRILVELLVHVGEGVVDHAVVCFVRP